MKPTTTRFRRRLRYLLAGTALAALLGGGGLALAHGGAAPGTVSPMGPGMMGPGMMGGGMMGPDMRGAPQAGGGMMGPGAQAPMGRGPQAGANPCAPAAPRGGMPGGMGMMGPGMGAPGGMGMMGPGMGMMGPGMGMMGMMRGMMGPGMGMMGPGMGMMGPGMDMMGPGMMAPGGMARGWGGPPWWPNKAAAAEPLGADDVKGWLERWLAMHGNPRITVGRVEEKDDDTIVAELVTKEGGVVVDKFEIDRRTGGWRRVPN